MADLSRTILLQTSKTVYLTLRPLLFLRSAQETHDTVLRLLTYLDASTAAIRLLLKINRIAFRSQPVTVGGVELPYPAHLAAGFVKGHGFSSEDEAMAGVECGENIIPGWCAVPALLGPVEFGSFTRWPRMGNPGTVIWRESWSRSTQNRVGLRNPGARAAAAFMQAHKDQLPPVFGVNIAVTPGLDELDQQVDEVCEAAAAFVSQGIYPSWFTLNLSCPNTEDDPGNHQTEVQTNTLCNALVSYLRTQSPEASSPIPLWAKIGPEFGDSQYKTLMRVFAETGVSAVVATNTLAQPVPGQAGLSAGIAGGELHRHAVRVVEQLMHYKQQGDYAVDIIGCGGIQDPISYYHFLSTGVTAFQYWSAMIYRGPLAGALILDEAQELE